METEHTGPRLIPLLKWARANDIPQRTALHWASKGDIPAVRIGGRWLVALDELEEQNLGGKA
jgi:predicted site-specific integrase-resolvase